MTYFLSLDYYAERHYESIGHARRIAFRPNGEAVWSCECGASSRTTHSERSAKVAHSRHVGTAQRLGGPSGVSVAGSVVELRREHG